MNETPSVLVAKDPISKVTQEIIDLLKEMALKAPLKRARYCLHMSHVDPVQEMVIVLHRDTYIRPHRHENKTESFHMIEGELKVAFFDDYGKIDQMLFLSDRDLYRLSAPLWHSVVPLTEFAVFHEVSTGPFSPSEFPAWEPENSPEAIHSFKQKILSFA